MNKFNILTVPFALIILIYTTLSFIQYGRDTYQELQEQRLEHTVNYAVDAAVDELVLGTADLGMDYADYERINASPDVAMESFCRIFCKNYNMSLSKENYTTVKTEYLPAFLVATYDGYYIAEPIKINSSGAHDAIFSMKQPYLYQTDDGSYYALNLGLKDARMFDGASISKTDAPIDETAQKAQINNRISDALMAVIYRQKEGNMHSAVYVPSSMTRIVTTNPVDRVTVMAYVSGIDAGYGELMEVFGIGGARVTHAKHVACYMKDGVPTYTYTEKTPSGVNVIITYESPTIAAQHGYYFDTSTLEK
jgi:hypothetical protein